MSYNLSTKDINFLQKFCILTNAFLITPWYDFQKQTFMQPILSKLYAFGVCLLKFVLVVLSIEEAKNSIVFQQLYSTQKFFFLTFLTFNVIQTIFQTVTSTFFHRDKWRQILINFEYVDIKLENRNRKESNVINNFYCRLLAKNVIFFALFIPYNYIWIKIMGDNVGALIFLNIVEVYNQFVLLIFLHCFVKSLKIRYRSVNKRLVFICCNSLNLTSDLKHFRKLLLVLAENVDLFNDSFGYYFLFTIIYCGLHIVHCANFIFLNVSFDHSRFETKAVLVNAIMVTFLTVSIKNLFTRL